MNKHLLILAAAIMVSIPLSSARADQDIAYFYTALAPYGTWHYVEGHGRVWQPSEVPANWRPYTRGNWVNTDNGWTWVSDYKDWGWAAFHYGRWTTVNQHGYVWVPGTEWGPAWVSWRQSDQNIAWAPLPPKYTYSARPSEVNIAMNHWNVVPVAHFGVTGMHRYYLPTARVRSVWPSIKLAYNVRPVGGIYINYGPKASYVRRVTGRPFARVSINVGTRHASYGFRGGVYHSYRPTFRNTRVVGPAVRVHSVRRSPVRAAVRVSAAPIRVTSHVARRAVARPAVRATVGVGARAVRHHGAVTGGVRVTPGRVGAGVRANRTGPRGSVTGGVRVTPRGVTAGVRIGKQANTKTTVHSKSRGAVGSRSTKTTVHSKSGGNHSMTKTKATTKTKSARPAPSKGGKGGKGGKNSGGNKGHSKRDR